MNRSDLTSRIPEFIALGEARMKRDKRLRKIQTLDFSAVEEYSLPTSMKALIELYHDGSTTWGEVIIVGAGKLGEVKRRYGDKGVPRFAAIIDGPIEANQKLLRFAPEPSGTFSLRLTYTALLDSLSSSNASNWLLATSPDLYLYSALSVAEGFLQEDNRVGLWKSEYEQAADEYLADRKDQEYGGKLIARPTSILGEVNY